MRQPWMVNDRTRDQKHAALKQLRLDIQPLIAHWDDLQRQTGKNHPSLRPGR